MLIKTSYHFPQQSNNPTILNLFIEFIEFIELTHMNYTYRYKLEWMGTNEMRATSLRVNALLTKLLKENPGTAPRRASAKPGPNGAGTGKRNRKAGEY